MVSDWEYIMWCQCVQEPGKTLWAVGQDLNDSQLHQSMHCNVPSSKLFLESCTKHWVSCGTGVGWACISFTKPLAFQGRRGPCLVSWDGFAHSSQSIEQEWNFHLRWHIYLLSLLYLMIPPFTRNPQCAGTGRGMACDQAWASLTQFSTHRYHLFLLRSY